MRARRIGGARLALLLLLGLVLTGCPAQWKFVFINEDATPLLVQVGEGERRFPPGERWRIDVPRRHHESAEEPMITVRDEAGALLHSVTSDSILFRPEVPREYPDRFVRVTRESITPIRDPSWEPWWKER